MCFSDLSLNLEDPYLDSMAAFSRLLCNERVPNFFIIHKSMNLDENLWYIFGFLLEKIGSYM